MLDTDDLFGDSPGITSSKEKKAASLFDDNDIFGEGVTKTKENKKDSLFDDGGSLQRTNFQKLSNFPSGLRTRSFSPNFNSISTKV